MRRASIGYTLIELLMVVAILSIVAVVAIPSSAPIVEFEVDGAASEVALALRFARDDARRTGQQRLFSCQQGAGTVTIGGVDTDKDKSFASDSPPLHTATTAGNNMAIVSCSFTFDDNASAASVVFDAAGNPVRGIGKGGAREQNLRAGAVVIGAAHARRTVSLDGTGRITITSN